MDEHAYRRLREYNDSLKAIDDTTAPPPAGSGCRNAPSDPLHAARRARAADAERDLRAAIPAWQTVHSALKRLEADGLLWLAHGGNRKASRLPDRKGARLAERTVDCIAEAGGPKPCSGCPTASARRCFPCCKIQQAAARSPRCAGRERHDDGQDLTPERKGRYGNPIIRSFTYKKCCPSIAMMVFISV